MLEKHLPLYLASESRRVYYLRLAAMIIGIFVVLWGAADITSRLAHLALGQSAGATIFGPAAAQDPSVLNALKGDLKAATTSALTPSVLKIPSIGVSAQVEQVGTKADGSMATPGNFDDVGWYSLGQKPGASGNAVFAGHVNNGLTKAGVFAHLDQVHLGDYVTVADASGKTLVYKVTAIDLYPADEAPVTSVFNTEGPSQVVLITCDGEWIQSEKTFNKRLVITASAVY